MASVVFDLWGSRRMDMDKGGKKGAKRVGGCVGWFLRTDEEWRGACG